MSLPAEFALIARHFRPLAGEGALDLADDAAVLDIPPGRRLVIAADAMVEGVHYLPDDPPETIGRKLLRVNLSDLAAMGAAPLGYLMTTAFTRGVAEAWIAGFVRGLAQDQREFGLTVLGGDTAATPGPTCLSLTILGTVAPGAVLRRAGALAGDDVWVSGTIGDGALGLRVLRGELPDDADGHLARRYRLPEPRLALGQAIAGLARAGMDVSDGLVQDLGHLCRAAGCGADVAAAAVPLSRAARDLVAADPALLPALLTGGDDYELVFTAAPDAAEAIRAAAVGAGTPVARIGRMVAGPPRVDVRDAAARRWTSRVGDGATSERSLACGTPRTRTAWPRARDAGRRLVPLGVGAVASMRTRGRVASPGLCEADALRHGCMMAHPSRVPPGEAPCTRPPIPRA